MRDGIAEARRVVVKVGSSSLTTTAGGIDPQRIDSLVQALAAAKTAGREIVLVSVSYTHLTLPTTPYV